MHIADGRAGVHRTVPVLSLLPRVEGKTRRVCKSSQSAPDVELRSRRDRRHVAELGREFCGRRNRAARGGNRPRQRVPGRSLAQDGRRSACSGITVDEDTAAPAWAISSMRRHGGDQPRQRQRRPLLRRAQQPVRQPDFAERHRRAEAPLSAAADQRRARRRAGDERARRRVRRGRHAPPRRQARRPLRAERHQDVDHQRSRRRRAGGLCQDRPGRRPARDHRVPGREGDARLQLRPEARQAGHARQQHRRAGVPGLRGAGRQRARQRRARRQRADERAGLRACGAGRRAARHHAGLHGRGAAVCARAQAVRPADRRASSSCRASSPTCM